MQKYVLTITKYFAGNKSTEFGGTEKKIVSGDFYDRLYQESILEENKDKEYFGDGLWTDSDEIMGGEDGYSVEWDAMSIYPVTEEEATRVSSIIDEYNKI